MGADGPRSLGATKALDSPGTGPGRCLHSGQAGSRKGSQGSKSNTDGTKSELEEGPDMKSQVRWEPMRVVYLGNVADIVQQGGGKLTATMGDPGEPRKVPSTG
jgi:hypothetical protein